MKNPSPGEYLWVVLCFILSLLTGISLCYWQMQNTLREDIHKRLNQAVVSLDITLSHAEQAAITAAPLVGQPCNTDVQTRLRTIVATIPDVRTVNLVKNDEIYCTSVFGGRSFKISRSDYTDGYLLLLGGNEVTPGRSLIVFRSPAQGMDNALIGIDGYYIYNILQVLGNESPLYMRVGKQWMTSKGQVVTTPLLEDKLTVNSARFPYSIVADSSYLFHPATFWRAERSMLFVVFAFSGLVTFLFSRYLRYHYTVESQLGRAIRNRQITPWMQAIVDAETGEVIGGEVLLRWYHPDHGFISPDTFITVAEQNGAIRDITRGCFSDVITQLKSYRGVVNRPFIVCFNISAQHFQDEEIVALCRHFQTHIPADKFQLVLEITEREFIDTSEDIADIITQLKQLDVKMSLDDFGTGNANYSYIRLFTPEYLKIDKVFTSDINDDELSTLVVESIITLADKMGCHVIAEGVENEQQMQKLQQMGVSHFQGYLFSRPVPIPDFLRLL